MVRKGNAWILNAQEGERINRLKRSKFFWSEHVVPRSHTRVRLNPRGERAFAKLTPEERQLVALDLTGGGGWTQEGHSAAGINAQPSTQLYFSAGGGGTPVYKMAGQVRSLLGKAEKRGGLSALLNKYREKGVLPRE